MLTKLGRFKFSCFIFKLTGSVCELGGKRGLGGLVIGMP